MSKGSGPSRRTRGETTCGCQTTRPLHSLLVSIHPTWQAVHAASSDVHRLLSRPVARLRRRHVLLRRQHRRRLRWPRLSGAGRRRLLRGRRAAEGLWAAVLTASHAAVWAGHQQARVHRRGALDEHPPHSRAARVGLARCVAVGPELTSRSAALRPRDVACVQRSYLVGSTLGRRSTRQHQRLLV